MSVRVNCPDCGDVQLENDDITMRLCVDDDTASYYFRCPCCRMVVAKDVHERIKELLVNCGIRVEPWSLPKELSETHDGPPITVDDCIDFHEALGAA